MLNGTLESRDCGVRVALGAETQHLERYYAKATRYTLVISVLTFVQVCRGAPRPLCQACATPLTLQSTRFCVWGVVVPAVQCSRPLLQMLSGSVRATAVDARSTEHVRSARPAAAPVEVQLVYGLGSHAAAHPAVLSACGR